MYFLSVHINFWTFGIGLLEEGHHSECGSWCMQHVQCALSPQGMDWNTLLAKKLKPPFLPNIKAPKDVSNFDEEFTSLKPVLTLPRTACSLSAEQQDIFADFDFSLLSWLHWCAQLLCPNSCFCPVRLYTVAPFCTWSPLQSPSQCQLSSPGAALHTHLWHSLALSGVLSFLPIWFWTVC